MRVALLQLRIDESYSHPIVEVGLRGMGMPEWAEEKLRIALDCDSKLAKADVTAFSAFKLLLECIDRRFWIWWEEVVSRLDTPLCARRNAFLRQGIGSIKKAIEKNEKSMFEHFLTAKVAEGQVWPWLNQSQD
ncbi:hypothetical protein P0D72_33970 [Paraburkholderia sediminicola]|uniref:hypothetical protein n=1 Tax=Paraburkholderia sediminicola TaxID=458836 RepID=UPI0038B73771